MLGNWWNFVGEHAVAITAVVAVIALIQVWIIGLVRWLRKKFKESYVDIVPFGHIEVSYTTLGPTIGLAGTLRCRGQDLFINSIDLEVIRHRDGAKHVFDWVLFRTEKLNFIGGLQQPELIMEAELPCGMILNTNQSIRYNILFNDVVTADEVNQIIAPLRENWQTFILTELESKPIQTLYEEFSKSDIHVERFTKLSRLCYWEAGDYTLIFIIRSSKPDNIFMLKWDFSLTEDNVKLLQGNALNIIREVLGVPFSWPYMSAYSKYKVNNRFKLKITPQ